MEQFLIFLSEERKFLCSLQIELRTILVIPSPPAQHPRRFILKQLIICGKWKPCFCLPLTVCQLPMTKYDLRKIRLAEQKSFSQTERNQKSQRISKRFFEAFDLSRVNFLHCFLSIEKFNEIDTNLIFQRIWQEFPHITTLVPRVNFQTLEIEHFKYTPATKLVENAWKIPEPAAGGETIGAAEIDLVLVPLLAFDECGNRVGYGKGFYDKFLQKCRADNLKIGLSYFATVTPISNVQDFDIKLDFCVTPQGIFEFGTSEKEKSDGEKYRVI